MLFARCSVYQPARDENASTLLIGWAMSRENTKFSYISGLVFPQLLQALKELKKKEKEANSDAFGPFCFHAFCAPANGTHARVSSSGGLTTPTPC